MRTSRFLLFCLLFALCGAAMAQENETGDAVEKDATEQATPSAAELPPRFVSKETIPPDSVISFPADI